MKALPMFKYISKYIALRWLPVMLMAAVFGIFMSMSDFRSAKRETKELIGEYGTYEQIPEEKLDEVDDFSPSLGMMYIVIISVSSSAFAFSVFGLAMQMSSTRRTMRKVFFAAMAELAVLCGGFYWLIQTVLYRIYASGIADKYPRLHDECLDYAGARFLCFYLLTGFAAATAGAFFALLLSRNKLAAGILAFVCFTTAVAGGVLLFFYAGRLASNVISISLAVVFSLLSAKAIGSMTLENNMFRTARR